MQLDFQTLNPGIRATVRLLRAMGFKTTDSGDGVTNVEAGMEGALPVPHVHCLVDKDKMIDEADWMRQCLLKSGIDVQSSMIAATYDPSDGVATVSLFGVSDATLRGDK